MRKHVEMSRAKGEKLEKSKKEVKCTRDDLLKLLLNKCESGDK